MISLANLDVGSIFSGIGDLARSLRAAITGKEPIDATKAAELALKVQELESAIEKTRISVMLAEASSTDKWTSRARPSFLYVIYILILMALPMGVVSAINPELAISIAKGMQAWLAAIPESLWAVFGVGYTGYTIARSVWDKNPKQKLEGL